MKYDNRIRFCDHCQCEREVEVLEREARYTFRKEPFDIIEQYMKCNICGNDVTDEKLGTETLKKLSQAYENKHSINAESIKELRQQFGLTQSLFSKILNMGIATIKRYESGSSSPSTTQIHVLKLLKNNPESILKFYEENKVRLTSEEQHAVEKKFTQLFSENELERMSSQLFEMIYKPFQNTVNNGFSAVNMKKFFHMIFYFGQEGVLKTKLMKLLWYADFLMYKRNRMSISGVPYIHKPFGPVPKDYEMVLGCLEGLNQISISTEEERDGFTRITITSLEEFEHELFTSQEHEVISFVQKYFEYYGSGKISDFAHDTLAWKETQNDELIPYSYAETIQLQ
ncbi:DUF4065 domain-containing protein [Paenibacillus thiaminolyticus]|nr:type II TA system antitoxin MqsA family protein [Paenibacillus thiaminolyticus]MCY9537764.1 DUF4065 domain-containing protein [Paenibacillus thiaminolyticus]MCY9600321.1 DUF4065 domain-containing protein [Paenibacillus thiaminolyticus]MCY9607349.1 DUF4065 domain-containing protein [Paenibacillus thiaminolyticus]MCY9613908.1 DUF4065 domain-containing protein [Paenibacillus thiaminolyticus]MCY9617913.1 DUF4065 domain-containing protein [Paenibacillus thiaminolyticus]